jgi:hypothetical protein
MDVSEQNIASTFRAEGQVEKLSLTFNELHGVISQESVLFVTTAVRPQILHARIFLLEVYERQGVGGWTILKWILERWDGMDRTGSG